MIRQKKMMKMAQTLDEFLDATDLENKTLEAAAKGDSDTTAHWLRTYKDVVKTYGTPLHFVDYGYRWNMIKKDYDKYKDMYFSFKKEIEEVLGERLYI